MYHFASKDVSTKRIHVLVKAARECASRRMAWETKSRGVGGQMLVRLATGLKQVFLKVRLSETRSHKAKQHFMQRTGENHEVPLEMSLTQC